MNTRRNIVIGGAGAVAGAWLSAKLSPAQARGKVAADAPMSVIGPVTGGHHGRAFGAYFGRIEDRGYIEEEYFISGSARRFQPIGPLTGDGKWTFAAVGSAPYQTRILVRRPRDRAKFNGTVVVEWTNVSSGFELASADTRNVYDGMAHVAVSAQQVGLTGFPTGKAQGLKQWDPARYGTLTHPGDSFGYDIFSQVARLIAPGARRRRANIDPLGGLVVRKLIAVGSSQSGLCLTGYVNAMQKDQRLFDAFMILISPGGASGYDDKVFNPPDPEMYKRFRTPVRIRDDLTTPVIVINSEAETLSFFHARQPDSDRYRFWEVAGASHAPTELVSLFDEKVVRDGLPAFTNPLHHSSDISWRATYDAALLHVQRWMNGGPPPPSQPPIDVVMCGGAPMIERDVYGNAKGGIRLPGLVAPIARYRGLDDRPGGGGLFGLTEPFTKPILAALYKTQADYVAKVTAAAEAAEKAGVSPPYQTQAYIAAARAQAIG